MPKRSSICDSHEWVNCMALEVLPKGEYQRGQVFVTATHVFIAWRLRRSEKGMLKRSNILWQPCMSLLPGSWTALKRECRRDQVFVTATYVFIAWRLRRPKKKCRDDQAFFVEDTHESRFLWSLSSIKGFISNLTWREIGSPPSYTLYANGEIPQVTNDIPISIPFIS